MSKCKICNTEYYLQNNGEPEEPCLCGANCPRGENWKDWVGYKAYGIWLLCKVVEISSRITDFGYDCIIKYGWRESK